jgi:hypothetical protein
MGMPQASSDRAGPSSLGSVAPSSSSVLSDSDSEINPFIDDEERDELLGTYCQRRRKMNRRRMVGMDPRQQSGPS